MNQETRNGQGSGDGPRIRITGEELDRILKRIHSADPRDFEAPSDETILAYLDGTATPGERAAVRDAWIRSRSFRRELVELAQEFDRYDPAARVEDLAFDIEEPVSPAEQTIRRAGRPLEWVRNAFSPLVPQAFAPILLRGGAPPPAPATAGRFVPDPARVRPTAVEAAVICLRERVQLVSGTLRAVKPPVWTRDRAGRPTRPDKPTYPIRMVEVRHEESGKPPVSVWFEFPAEAHDLLLWLLLVPSLELYSASLEVAPESTWISRSPGECQQAFFALSFAVPGGHLAEPPAATEAV